MKLSDYQRMKALMDALAGVIKEHNAYPRNLGEWDLDFNDNGDCRPQPYPHRQPISQLAQRQRRSPRVGARVGPRYKLLETAEKLAHGQGLSANALGLRVGISGSTISRYLNGQEWPTSSTIEDIARILHVQPVEIADLSKQKGDIP